jgi:tRNA modification GTPase
MLAALSRARSPLAIDLLLDQPRRWAGASPRDDNERDRALRRLIDPPLVVALGPPNVGKSSLVNALAGRCVSIVADEPGTTRDHVGVMLDLAGLVVRYVDTPGLLEAPSEIEREAMSIALELAASADLLVLVGDASAAPIPIPSLGARPEPSRALRDWSVTLAARSDLGLPAWPYDAAVSSRTGDGLIGLSDLIRDRLVPPAMLADPSPWVFWAGGD